MTTVLLVFAVCYLIGFILGKTGIKIGLDSSTIKTVAKVLIGVGIALILLGI